jgi:triosephosphate isomerase
VPFDMFRAQTIKIRVELQGSLTGSFICGGKMRQKLVMGNWKMHGFRQDLMQLTQELHAAFDVNSKAQVVVIPPALYLPMVKDLLAGSQIHLGAQNVYPQDCGAFTGELSAPMFVEFGCRYVLVGHSERRHGFGESENFVAQKFHHVKDHGMIPVLCVGETLAEREKGLTQEVLARQLLAVSERDRDQCFSNAMIAYEPVWAIGTGKTATPEQAQEVHQWIRNLVSETCCHEVGCNLPLIYGGSVNEQNAAALFQMPDIDGGLVGGASLCAKQFIGIVRCIN